VSYPRNTRHIVAIKKRPCADWVFAIFAIFCADRLFVRPKLKEGEGPKEGRPVSQSKSPRTSANHSKECNGKSAQILDGWSHHDRLVN
jgi:hypothetical protein